LIAAGKDLTLPTVQVIVAGMMVMMTALVWGRRPVAGSVDLEGATGVWYQGNC